MDNEPGKPPLVLRDLFPDASRILLTGTGKDFIERLGVEAVRRVILAVMMGENIRTQTEPLTRRRIAQTSGGLVALYVKGMLQIEGFTDNLSQLAVDQIETSRYTDKSAMWPALWVIGLTGKQVQNVLRSRPEDRMSYIADFEAAVNDAADKCRVDIGEISVHMGFAEYHGGRTVELNWRDITRLTTAIGSQTLTLRGSDKSMYGKLFERLVLGSLLTILGFERINPALNNRTSKVFYLSDSSQARESDATAIYRSGRLVKFDIGFIGPGNSEISKDKLTRFANHAMHGGATHEATTFVIVDRLPATSKTKALADAIHAEIVQMSMQFWPRDVARRLGVRLGFKHALQTMPDADMREYLYSKLSTINVQDFLSGVNLNMLGDDAVPRVSEDGTEYSVDGPYHLGIPASSGVLDLDMMTDEHDEYEIE